MWLRGTVEGCGGSKRDCLTEGGGVDCIGINGDRSGFGSYYERLFHSVVTTQYLDQQSQ
jgi:hypothetical protein